MDDVIEMNCKPSHRLVKCFKYVCLCSQWIVTQLKKTHGENFSVGWATPPGSGILFFYPETKWMMRRK